MTTAVCYVASAGHLFQTMVSATQALKSSGPDVEVHVVFVSRGSVDGAEFEVFAAALDRAGVSVTQFDQSRLNGLHAVFGRLFLADALPADIDRILYLDGDTQVLGDLGPLLRLTPPPSGIVATLDPMVLLRDVDERLRSKIDMWWDASAIPKQRRLRYINSGVFLVDRSALPAIRRRAVETATTSANLIFADQDAINLIEDLPVDLLSLAWNFPGFLLGTRAEAVIAPRIVHFMSRPRPWEGPFNPWGMRYFSAYEDLVHREPTLRDYWEPLSGFARRRYAAQQLYKSHTERRLLKSDRTERAVRALERDVLLGLPPPNSMASSTLRG